MEKVTELAEQLLTPDHWPWVAVCAIFAIVGQFTSKRFFTKERAYAEGYWGPVHQFWFWGRETLPMQPIIGGLILAMAWPDPEGKGWGFAPTAAYFASSGVASMFAWVVFKARAKKKGLNLQLPGASVVPDMTDVEVPPPVSDTDPPPSEES